MGKKFKRNLLNIIFNKFIIFFEIYILNFELFNFAKNL
jgi:hypothetical protein